jgi:hypothetical protein
LNFPINENIFLALESIMGIGGTAVIALSFQDLSMFTFDGDSNEDLYYATNAYFISPKGQAAPNESFGHLYAAAGRALWTWCPKNWWKKLGSRFNEF